MHPFVPNLRIAFVAFLLAALPTVTASPGPDREIPGVLRVRLLEQLAPRSVTVDAPDSGLGAFVGDEPVARVSIPGGTRVTLIRTGNAVRMESVGETLLSVSIRLEPSDGEAIALHVGSANRAYLGALHVSVDPGSSALRLVNHVPLEDYVASVVASEYGLDDVEGSKAMAVIARTYALKALRNADYDQVDHTLSQVYKGMRGVTERAIEAAQSTAGEVLTYDGELIVATYYSSSGGHTANNEDVWQATALPYLRARMDPWDRVSPHRAWTWQIEADRLHAMLREAFGTDARSVSIAARSVDGRARALRVSTSAGRERVLSSQDFRLEVIRAFGPAALRSTLFDLRVEGGRYVFTGRGFGHGVGLSQWGAHAMALDGKSYREILDFYYRDVRLEKARVAPADGGTIAGAGTAPDSLAPATADSAAVSAGDPASAAGRAAARLKANAAARGAVRPVGWSGAARDTSASKAGPARPRRGSR